MFRVYDDGSVDTIGRDVTNITRSGSKQVLINALHVGRHSNYPGSRICKKFIRQNLYRKFPKTFADDCSSSYALTIQSFSQKYVKHDNVGSL